MLLDVFHVMGMVKDYKVRYVVSMHNIQTAYNQYKLNTKLLYCHKFNTIFFSKLWNQKHGLEIFLNKTDLLLKIKTNDSQHGKYQMLEQLRVRSNNASLDQHSYTENKIRVA